MFGFKKKDKGDVRLRKKAFLVKWKRRFRFLAEKLIETVIFLATFRFIGPIPAIAGFALYFLLAQHTSRSRRIFFGLLVGSLALGLQIAYATWH